MRWMLPVVMALGVVGSAQAQTGEIFAEAQSTFAPLSPAAITEGLDGEWLPLSLLGGATASSHADPELVSDLLERFCGSDPQRGHQITTDGAARFAINEPGSAGMVYTFDWLGGTRFARSFDGPALFDRLGLSAADDENGLAMRATALSQTAREANIFRVAPEMIVISTAQNAEIFGRCPDI